jgi:hypothetical protein
MGPLSRQHSGQIGQDQLVKALNLFRLGSVQALRHEGKSLAFKNWNVFGGSPSRPGNFSYTLRVQDGSELQEFLQKVPESLPSGYERPQQEEDFFTTAMGWYEHVLFLRGPDKAGVAWAVACLEALYLGDDPTNELNYRLGLRLATLLRCFGFPALLVKKNLRDAYMIRSKYVHGARPPKNFLPETMKSLVRTMADYARVSLLMWRTIRDRKGREIFLDLIEDAILDRDRARELQAKCDAVALPSMRPVSEI